jgi:hypothetical protein
MSDLDVLKGPDQLFGQRAVTVLPRPCHRAVKAKPGLHGDGHLVQGVC